MLRKLADDIDAGKYGDVSMVLPVMLRPSETGEAVELFMFGSGYDRNRFSATGLLTAAIFALNN